LKCPRKKEEKEIMIMAMKMKKEIGKEIGKKQVGFKKG